MAVTALERVNGTKFKHGSIASELYVTSGGSVDWAYDKGIYSF